MTAYRNVTSTVPQAMEFTEECLLDLCPYTVMRLFLLYGTWAKMTRSR